MAAILHFRSEPFQLFTAMSDQSDFSYFQSASHPDTSYKFQVNWPLGSLEEVQNKLSRWPPSCISDQNHFSYLPQCFLPSFKSIGLLVQDKKLKIDFQDGHHGINLRFPVGRILAISDLQVAPILPTKFRVNWPFSSGDSQDRIFKMAAFLDFGSNDFSYVSSTSCPATSY